MSRATAPLEPMPFRYLVDEAMRRWRRHFREIFPPFGIAVAVTTLLFQVVYLRSMGSIADLDADPFAVFTNFGTLMVVSIVAMAVYLVLYSVLEVRIIQVVLGEPGSLGSALRALFRPPVIGTLLLTYLFIGIGALFCLLPGIYLYVVFSFVLPIVIAEEVAGGAALKRSRRLALYNPAGGLSGSPIVKLIGVFVIGWVIAWIASTIVQVPGLVIQQVQIFRQVSGGETPADPQAVMASAMWVTVPGQILNSVVQIATSLYLNFAVVLLYFDVRNRKEGGDLAQALDRLEAGPGA